MISDLARGLVRSNMRLIGVTRMPSIKGIITALSRSIRKVRSTATRRADSAAGERLGSNMRIGKKNISLNPTLIIPLDYGTHLMRILRRENRRMTLKDLACKRDLTYLIQYFCLLNKLNGQFSAMFSAPES